MKLCQSLPMLLAVFVTVNEAAASDDVTSTNAEPSVVFASAVNGRAISPSVITSVNRIVGTSMQVAFLTGLVTNTTSGGANHDLEVASALRLLGVAKQTNSISILVSRITFRHDETGTYPAAEALIAFGETASPTLLALVCNSTNNVEISHAVRALSKIKGGGYAKFVEAQRSVLPEKEWKKLVMYAIRP